MSSDNKTEQATPRRQQKAREQGQVARSRELSGAVAVMAAFGIALWRAPELVIEFRELYRAMLSAAIAQDLAAPGQLMLPLATALARWCAPAMAGALAIATVAAIAQGGLVFAPATLQPNVSRMSPSSRLKQLFSMQALNGMAKSLLPGVALTWVAYRALSNDWQTMLQMPWWPAPRIVGFALERGSAIVWQAGLVMLAWAALDYLLVRLKHDRDLRMSRQEIREEYKETEGDPTVKGRIRRLQRQVRRKRMLQDVERASVVVTNPTHYAIALTYRADMAAPVVVAKGRDRLAEEIKQVARWYNVPMVENPPLAHALYRSVEVGQSIPANLYRAIAEVLAMVFRAQQRAEGGRA